MRNSRLVLPVLLLGVAGCLAPPVVHHYPGPEHPPDQVAVLYHNTERGFEITRIDGTYVQNRLTTFNPDGWDEVHLEPGMHTLTGGLYLRDKYAIFVKRYRFEAGKKYRLMYAVDDIGANVSFYLEAVE